MELRRIDRLLLKALYLLAAGILVSQVLGQETLTSLLFTMTFPLTVLVWLRTVRKTLTGTDLMVLGTIALSFACVLVDAAIHNASLSFSYLKKVIMFSMTLLFFQSAFRLRVDQGMIKFIERVIDCVTLFLMVMYLFRTSEMFSLNGRVTTYLTFRMSNPNLTGMFVACLYILELYRIFKQKKWYRKIGHILMSAFLGMCVIQTQSRNALMVMMLFTVICVWLIFRGMKNMCVSGFVASLIAVLPALFVMLYFFLLNSPWIGEVFSFLIDEGKDLNSREIVWTNAREAIQSSPIIGAYATISRGSGQSQMHNSHLDIAASYGLPTMALVCVLLRKYLFQRRRTYENKQSYLHILGFASVLMLGIGEAALFSGGLGIYVFAGTLLLLARCDGG